jgi:hypothetical protein
LLPLGGLVGAGGGIVELHQALQGLLEARLAQWKPDIYCDGVFGGAEVFSSDSASA